MIPFQDLRPLHALLRSELREAIDRVFDSGWYILGPEVEAFESELAAWLGMPHCVAVANGTDALELALRAAGIGPGDEVITASHTAVATVCAIERAGAVPVLADIDSATMTLSPAAAENAVTARTRAIVPVHLYGHMADMDALSRLASKHRLLLIEDAAQALGAQWNGRPAGAWGEMATFSFYPTKTVAALGDAGAVVCRDQSLAQRIRRLRTYGQASREAALEQGQNSRMDEIQAAVLRVKLAHITEHRQSRRNLASRYAERLPADIQRPVERPEALHAYHLYVIRHPQRDRLRQTLLDEGIETLVHYPLAVHQQPAYARLAADRDTLPATERAAAEVLSLPLYIGLKDWQLDRVAETIARARAEIEA